MRPSLNPSVACGRARYTPSRAMTGYAGAITQGAQTAPRQQPPDPEPPRGAYAVRSSLGAGAMGEALLAEDTRDGVRVVIKRMHPHCAADPTLVEMFHHEARVLGALSHPGVVRRVEFARDDRGLMLVLEHIPGVDLASLKERTARWPVPCAVEIAVQLLDILAAVHALSDGGVALGVVHGDIAPGNVRITPDGAVKLMDFGISTSAWRCDPDRGIMKGTRGYMAPEVITGEREIDARIDQFAVAVMLYELLAGERLYEGSAVAVMTAIVEDPIAPIAARAGVSEALGAVVMRGLSRRAEDRHATAAAMRDALLGACVYDRAEARRHLAAMVTA